MLMNKTKGYRMGLPRERNIKKTNSLFIDDLKVYQEVKNTFELVNYTIVQAIYVTGARYGVKKCAEVVFNRVVMVKGKGLDVMEERMESIDSDSKDYYKFLGLEQANGIGRHYIYQKVKQN